MAEMEWIEKGRDWLLTNGPDFAVNIVIFLLILIVGKFVIGMLGRMTKTVLGRTQRVDDTLSAFILNVQNKVLWVIVLMAALPRLGVDIAPLIAGLGVTGFVIGFAFQESLGNLAAGLMILLNRPFEKGNYVEAGGHAGTVREINMMATTLDTPDNRRITIPNRNIWGNPIINYTVYDKRRVDMTVGIGYGADIGKAISAVKRVLEADVNVLKEPTPVIEVVELADSSINLVVRPWSETAHYWDVYFRFHREVKAVFDAEGIEIPFPQMDVHLDPVQTA